MKGAFQEAIRLSTGSRKVRLLYGQPLGCGRAGKAVGSTGRWKVTPPNYRRWDVGGLERLLDGEVVILTIL